MSSKFGEICWMCAKNIDVPSSTICDSTETVWYKKNCGLCHECMCIMETFGKGVFLHAHAMNTPLFMAHMKLTELGAEREHLLEITRTARGIFHEKLQRLS